MEENRADNVDHFGPKVKFPPPLVFVTALVFSRLLQSAMPIYLGHSVIYTWLGLVFIAAGFALVAICWIQFKRAKTEIEPWKPTSAIISSGVYAFSRNPIYIAFSIIAIGFGFYWRSGWTLVCFIPAIYVVFKIAIEKEEAYLSEKFGEEYEAYKNRVRRWL